MTKKELEEQVVHLKAMLKQAGVKMCINRLDLDGISIWEDDEHGVMVWAEEDDREVSVYLNNAEVFALGDWIDEYNRKGL